MKYTLPSREIGEINVNKFQHINPGDIAIIHLFDPELFGWIEDQYLKGRCKLLDTPDYAEELAACAQRLLGRD